jgi:hypothetical protein
MSGMAMKFTSLAQIEANQFVSADDRLYLEEAEDFGAGVPRARRRQHHFTHFLQVAADAAMARNRSADGLSLRQTRTGEASTIASISSTPRTTSWLATPSCADLTLRRWTPRAGLPNRRHRSKSGRAPDASAA